MSEQELRDPSEVKQRLNRLHALDRSIGLSERQKTWKHALEWVVDDE